MNLNEALRQATISVPDAGRIFFDLARNASYEAAKSGDIPTIKVGGLLRVPVAKLCEMLGIDREALGQQPIQKGPAKAATFPDRGSTKSHAKEIDMNSQNHSTAAPVEASAIEIPKLSDAREILTRLKDLNELMFMAGEGLFTISRSAGNAITAGCDEMAKKLAEVCDILDAQEGGDA